MLKYIDVHSHLNSTDYDADRDAVMKHLEETETGTIVVGVDYESSKWAVEIAEQNENIWACVGVHPSDNPNEKFVIPNFELLISKKVVAIGECGMDFSRLQKESDFERQLDLFLPQIEFALAHDLPIMIHARDAYPELLAILEPLKKIHAKKLRGNVHFFAGSLEEAKRFWDIGFATSFTGVITFTHDYDEVIKQAPLHMLMSETDAPYVAPVPYRGKRNEPSYVQEVVKKIAEIRGEDLEVVQKTLLSNACRLFGIMVG